MTRWLDSEGMWPAFVDSLRPRVASAATLEDAAQIVCEAITAMFPTTVLVRAYALLPLPTLPPDVQRFAASLAGDAKLEGARVLTLLGTHGRAAAWCDRRTSKGHKGLPLVSARFVQQIPMLARLLRELGLDLAWLDAAPALFSRRLLGGFNGVFYVGDASSASDAEHRLIIPAQDFVAEHQVRTVFGMGGVNPDGTLLTVIAFTQETIPRALVERLTSLISMLKSESFGLVLQQRLFRIDAGDG